MTRAGRLEGTEERHGDRDLAVFRGIPYAEPPLGPRRWQPPGPVRPWAGTRAAVAFGPAAPQSGAPVTELPAAAMETGGTSEDCLTLNVWAPARAASRPVMVWLHGGSFLSGSSAMPTYEGARLAAEGDVVVVSANYRLGVLGFTPVGGTANLGLLDQVLALTWVRDNIDGFGGDPGEVTVFGESAGGGSVLHLLGSPRAQGLVRRAIIQSGATALTLSGEQAADVADRVRRALGPTGPARAAVEQVLDVQLRVMGDLIATLGTMPFHPAVDGDVVPARPVEALAGGQAEKVGLLVGTTADEMRLFLDPASWTLERPHLERRAARYLALLGITGAEPVLAAYDDLPTPTDVWAALRTDAELWLPAVAVAEAHRGPTFAYRFDWPAAPPHARLRACHAIDLPFTFDTFDRCGWAEFVGAGTGATALGRSLRAAWVAFARCGDPSTDRFGSWPTYTPADRATMLLGSQSAVALDPRGSVRRAWGAAPRDVPGRTPRAPAP